MRLIALSHPLRTPTELPTESPSVILLLWSEVPEREVLETAHALRQRYPTADVLGCSTAGVITNGTLIDHGVGIGLLFLDGPVRTISLRRRGLIGEVQLAQRVAQSLGNHAGPLLVLCEGLGIDGDLFARAIGEALPQSTIFGGMAGDGERFQRTLLLHNTSLNDNGLVAVALPEGIHTSSAVGCGWQPIGPIRTVTEAFGSLVLRIDDEPALDLYSRYLGPHAAHLPASGHHFPLLVSPPGKTPFLRSIIGIDPQRQALRFTTAIPEGSTVRLMHASIPDVLDHAHTAAYQIPPQATMLFMVSCVARRHVLGPLAADEATVVAERAPIPTIGWYSYGELAPNPCVLHNQTLCLTALYPA